MATEAEIRADVLKQLQAKGVMLSPEAIEAALASQAPRLGVPDAATGKLRVNQSMIASGAEWLRDPANRKLFDDALKANKLELVPEGVAG